MRKETKLGGHRRGKVVAERTSIIFLIVFPKIFDQFISIL